MDGDNNVSLKARILEILREGPLTAKEVAVKSGATAGNAHYHLQRLVAQGQVSLFEAEEGNVVEKRYRIGNRSEEPAPSPVSALFHDVSQLALTVAETGQVVNELTALLHRWQTVSQTPRGRTQGMTMTLV